jgi:hypothetical protein
MNYDLLTRAQRWSDTLHDLARFHKNPKLQQVGDLIDHDFINQGKDLTLAEEASILQAAADAFVNGAPCNRCGLTEGCGCNPERCEGLN